MQDNNANLDQTENLIDALEKLHRFLDAYFHLAGLGMVEDGSGLLMMKDVIALDHALRPLMGSNAEYVSLDDYTPTSLLKLLDAAARSAMVSEAMTQLRSSNDELQILAQFVPQAFIRGDAVEIDWENDMGENAVDVTQEVLQMSLDEIVSLEDGSESAEDLLHDSNISENMRKHIELYPYRINVETAIDTFFYSHFGCDRSRLTQAQLSVLRAKYSVIT